MFQLFSDKRLFSNSAFPADLNELTGLTQWQAHTNRYTLNIDRNLLAIWSGKSPSSILLLMP